MKTNSSSRKLYRWFGRAILLFSLALTGCQVDVGGQTLPSPWYFSDDIQYFAHGPEFLLANEANEMRKYKTEKELEEKLPAAE